jgi:hypothetical protein
MIETFDPKQKANEKRYYLSCKVLAKDCSYEDEQSTGTTMVSEQLVFLIPNTSTERDLFYSAWLPENPNDPQELGVTMGHPVYSTFRAALWRATEYVREIHLFVMSKGAEEILKRLDGQVVNVEILGEQEDYLLDGQVDHDLSLNKNKYEKVTHIGDKE